MILYGVSSVPLNLEVKFVILSPKKLNAAIQDCKIINT